MIKKFFNILWLLLISFSINCMNLTDTDHQRSEQSPYVLTQEDVLFYKGQLSAFIEAGAEDTLIDFLKDEHSEEQAFARQYLPYLYKAAHNAKLDKVIRFMKKNCINSRSDAVKCAIKINDLDTAKRLTNFKNFTPSNTIRIADFGEDLQNSGLDPFFLERILCRVGINYRADSTGERYIHMLLKRDSLNSKCKKQILRFISNLSKTEINIQDDQSENTIFHEALYAYGKYQNNNDVQSMQNVEEIIKALFVKGANVEIKNAVDVAPNEFSYFDDHIREWTRESLTNGTSTSKTKKSLDPKKDRNRNFNNSSKILAFAGISLIGAAAFYLYYKLINKSHVNKVKLK